MIFAYSIPSMEELVNFYLEYRSILLVNEPKNNANTDANAQKCIELCLSITGINPSKLASYPKLTEKLGSFLETKKTDIMEIEDNYMTPLVNFLFESLTIDDFVEALKSQNNDKLHARFLDMLANIEECGICLDKTASVFFQCAHKACNECATKVITCPFCRELIIIRLDQKNEEQNAQSIPHKLPKFLLVEDAETFLSNRLSGFLKQTRAMNSTEMQEVDMILRLRPDLFDMNFVKSMKSEEVISFVLAKWFWYNVLHADLAKGTWTPEEKSLAMKISQFLKPSRLIRFLNVLVGADPVKDEKISIKFSNALRKWLVKTVDNWKLPDYEEILQRKGFWVWLFRGVHIGLKKFDEFKTAKSVADLVRGNRKPETVKFMKTFEDLYLKNDPKVLELVLTKPSMGFRLLRAISKKLQVHFQDNTHSTFFKQLFSLLSTSQIIELVNVFSKPFALSTVYRTKTGKLYEATGNQMMEIPSMLIMNIRKALLDELSTRKIERPVVIEKTDLWDNLHLSRGKPMKTPPWSSIMATSGDKIKLEPEKQYILFIHWVQKQQRVDLDLSVELRNADGSRAGIVDFTRLRDSTGRIIHSGDRTNAPAPNGASEYITFCPGKISGTYQTMVMSCFSYTGVSFEEMEVAVVGISVLDTKSKGLGPNGSHVISCCQLQGKANAVIVGSFDFDENLFTFMNIPSKRSGYGLSLSRDGKRVHDLHEMYLSWLRTRSPPSFQQVAESYMSMVDTIIILENGKAVKYEKKENSKSALESMQLGLGEPVNSFDIPSICFITEEKEYFKIPPNSIVISKKDPMIDNVRWNSDPYSIL